MKLPSCIFRIVLVAAFGSVAPAASISQMLPASALRGKTVLFVVGAPDAGHVSDDAAVKQHLQSMGMVVTEVYDADPSSKAEGKDLVIISSTANARVVQGAYKECPIPVFTWNTGEYPDMAMTGPHLHTDFEVVEPVQHYARAYSELYGYGTSATTPIARAVGMTSELFGTFYLRTTAVGWGKPAPSATVVTTFEGDPGKAGLFTYEKGSSMIGDFPAPARRVGFFMQDDNFHELSAVYGPGANDPQLRAWYIGLKLFDASIRWALSPPQEPQPYDPAKLQATLATAAKGKKILFVERIDTPEGKNADAHMVAHLRSMGFRVTVADQMDPQSRAEGYDLVILSATCSKYKLSNKYRDIAVPVLCLEGLFADTLRMAGRVRYTDYGEHGEEKESDDPPENYLNIVGSYSPMAAGLKPGLVKFTNEQGTIKWAIPSPGAVVIATLPDESEQRAIFGYEKGATMNGYFVAPARRALFPLDNPAYDDLTEQGHALFDAAVLWTISGPHS